MDKNRNNLLMMALLLFGLLLSVAGCPQGEDPAEAMAREYNARQSKSAASDTSADQQAGNVQDAAGAPLDAAGNPCGDTTAEAEYTGPVVTIMIDSITNNIPEYDGKAKYDIKLEVQSDEVPATPGVWEIVAFDEDGEKVGESKKHLTIPSAYPKILALYDFYCTQAPVSFQIQRTAGKAIAVEDALADSSAGKKGSGVGGRGVAGGGGEDEEDEAVGGEDE